MTKAAPVLVLGGPSQRAIARAWVASAPRGTCVRFDPPRRTLPQNSRLHAVLTEVARQVEWPTDSGVKRTVEAWKDIFTAALMSAKHQLDIVPGINGGFVLLGLHTSALSKEDFGELMDLIDAFAAEHGVDLSDISSESFSPAKDPAPTRTRAREAVG